MDGSNIYVTDTSNNALLKLDKTGKLLKLVGQREGEKESLTDHWG